MMLSHDMPLKPMIRAHVFRTTPHHWWWAYASMEPAGNDVLRHGPFDSQADAYASAWHMVELL